MLKPPKNWFNQSIVLHQKISDPNGLYPDEVTDTATELNACVVHLRTTYSGSNNNREVVANGTVILMNDITSPFPELSVKDANTYFVEYEGKEYKVVSINEDREPMSNKIYQYKLQIL